MDPTLVSWLSHARLADRPRQDARDARNQQGQTAAQGRFLWRDHGLMTAMKKRESME
jgi:hypothetical protein